MHGLANFRSINCVVHYVITLGMFHRFSRSFMQMKGPYFYLFVTASSRILSNLSLLQLAQYSILCQLTLHFPFRYTAFFFFFHSTSAPNGPGPPPCQGFTIKLRHTTLGRASVGEWSTPRRAFYLKTLRTHKRQKSMPPAGFEPTIPGSERPQTHALDSAVTAIGSLFRTDL